MSELLPLLFIALSGLALSAVLYALWQSVRLLFTASERDVGSRAHSDAEREALLSEKHELLTAIRDVQFERDLGKVSPRDFERLDARYRARARKVLQQLDEQLSPYRARADALLNEAIGGGDAKTEPDSKSDPDVAPAATGNDARVCSACEQQNDGDAVFCKKCAARLVPEEAK